MLKAYLQGQNPGLVNSRHDADGEGIDAILPGDQTPHWLWVSGAATPDALSVENDIKL